MAEAEGDSYLGDWKDHRGDDPQVRHNAVNRGGGGGGGLQLKCLGLNLLRRWDLAVKDAWLRKDAPDCSLH